jgi:hypothetical protein
MLIKYNLPDPEYYLDNPKTKDKKAVDNINKERNSKLLARTHSPECLWFYFA